MTKHSTIFKAIFTACVLASSPQLLAQAVKTEQTTQQQLKPIQGELSNGLKFNLLPLNHEKGHIEIRLRVEAGSVDEADHQAGVAHMVEHLVFRATQDYPNGLMNHLHSEKWGRGRHYNAVTNADSTTYMLTPAPNVSLEQSLHYLSQMVFHAQLTQKDLDDERKIILEEWRQGLGVGATMNEQRTASVRANSRYTRHRVIGTENSINTMPATELQDFYQRWYQPNNMTLLIVGDINVPTAKAAIERYFGQAVKKALPVRDYLEPTLSKQLLINKLQDPRSGVSQIAYILRFDESRSREQTEQGRYERLLDRIALTAITQRLRNQSESLPAGVSGVTPRKSDIGKTTVALGFFASVGEKDHQRGLQQIFDEIERLKRYPITETELEKIKKPIFEQIANAKKHSGERDFAGWMQQMIESVLVGKPYLSQPEIAALTEPMLAKISLSEVNQRIQDWLNAEDRIVQYQPPRNTQIEPITQEMVLNLQKNSQNSPLAAPEQAKEIVPMALGNLSGEGKIVKTEKFPEQKVVQWQLSNGDKVVWLKSALAKEKTYFQADSRAGFKADFLGSWQSQLASQLIAQNAPLDWVIEQLNHWKTLTKVNLSIKQTATKLQYDGTADNAKLADLLRLYYAYQVETKVKDGLDETKGAIAQAIDLQNADNDDNRRVQAIAQLRYGKLPEQAHLPKDKAELTALTEDDLNQQWQKMAKVPTTFYFVNDMDESEMQTLVQRYLAIVPRDASGEKVAVRQNLAIEGKGESRLKLNPEPKADVRIWSFTPTKWQGKTALQVALLRNIASNQLKLAMRDGELGIYSLKFDSSLNQESQRIESELSFTTAPEKADKMVALAERVLRNLQVSEAEVKQAKQQFLQGEKQRLAEPRTWLNRLVLSENQYGNPSYLSQMQQLADGITLEQLQQTAKSLFNPDNVKIFIIEPKETK